MQGFQRRVAVETLQDMIVQNTPALPAQEVDLHAAQGRVLAQAVTSAMNVPAFVRSAMDGYALRAEESYGASEYNPLCLRVIGQSLPGQSFAGEVSSGEAVRIMTGAPIPQGANAVLMAEYATEKDALVSITAQVATQKNIGRIGEDIAQGTVVLPKNRRLRPQDVGLLASIGVGRVQVYPKPQVCLLITGNELLKPGEVPHGHFIVDSNSMMLQGLVERDGGRILQLLHLRDDKEMIEKAMCATSCDLLICTGGSSVGQEDLAPVVVAERGQLLAHGVAMRPSAPTGFGLVKGKPIFLLPGNPISCLAAYDFFTRLALRKQGGFAHNWPYPKIRLPLTKRIASQIGRLDYARVRKVDDGVEFISSGGASALSTACTADGFVVVPQNSEGYGAGETVSVWLYDLP